MKKITIESIMNSVPYKGYEKYINAMSIASVGVFAGKAAKKIGLGKTGQGLATIAGGFAWASLLAKCEKMAEESSADIQAWVEAMEAYEAEAEARGVNQKRGPAFIAGPSFFLKKQ